MELKITLEQGQNMFFTSDTHYDHVNICRGTTAWNSEGRKDRTRDFDTLERMNDSIVEGINSVVGRDDILFNLGDWSFNGFDNIKKFRDRIICQNIYEIYGNHDNHIKNNKGSCKSLFTETMEYCELTVVRPSKPDMIGERIYNFILFHYPITSWNYMSRGWIHLHGHVHLSPENAIQEGRAMDVGVDGSKDMKPYSLKDIIRLVGSNPIRSLVLPSDHHTD